MKQKLDLIRTLAIRLYEAGQKEKRQHHQDIFGSESSRIWRDLPSESQDVWDAVAICAYRELERKNK
jgi:hypothetical protein